MSEAKKVELTVEQTKQVLDTPVTMKVQFIKQWMDVITVCQSRGAFQPLELESVGSMFRVLSNTVDEAAKKVVEATSGLESVEEETIEEVSSEEQKQ